MSANRASSTPKTGKRKNFGRLPAKSAASTKVGRVAPKGSGGSNLRDNATIKRLQMYKTRPKRSRDGEFIAGDYMSKVAPVAARIEPNRKWFGNTKTISQNQMDTFRTALESKMNDPYCVLLKQKNLPMGLLSDPLKTKRMNLLTTESYEDTFGGKRKRKKPKLSSVDLLELVTKAEAGSVKYSESSDKSLPREHEYKQGIKHKMFEKGQSKRIWGELYKVLDSSDVVVQVLDARDPMGTRCPHVESHLKKNARYKHLIFVLNKCDLVPTWVTKKWVALLSQEYPTLAFHASITKSFGKGALIQLLRQFGRLHSDKKNISVGFIGYPNVGKSSIINTLRAKKVSMVSPVPGETKVWQYVTLFKRVFLIDCPGVVYPSGDSEVEIVLKGVVRIESLIDAADYIDEVLKRVKREYVQKLYDISNWTTTTDFITQFANKTGRLVKGGDPDLNAAAKMVLHDWIRGRLPYYVAPPEDAPVAAPRADVPHVKQILSNIKVAEQIQDELPPPADSTATPAQAEEEEQVDWDEVYQDTVGETVPIPSSGNTAGSLTPSSSGGKEAEDEEGDGDDDGDDAAATTTSAAKSKSPASTGKLTPKTSKRAAKKMKKAREARAEADEGRGKGKGGKPAKKRARLSDGSSMMDL
eukprot:gnl/Hemi2/9992_TR3460_c0_g1_i1.p1 gnl/Hemi2/9992_TR3460_c0_g1~~gnl/Hemi2/9992_TR3460_c0_g1_i1.p1  ORF type:complete len:641 (-),score=236.01 gnl/Hemi2/9992_TR3460_c0_g1_i1:113-2035(-)